jgi:hypothetical protein
LIYVFVFSHGPFSLLWKSFGLSKGEMNMKTYGREHYRTYEENKIFFSQPIPTLFVAGSPQQMELAARLA